MKLPDFPDGPPPGSHKTPTTIDNVQHLLEGAGISVRYNLIKKKDEIVIPEHSGTVDNLDNVTLSNVVSLASKFGLPTGLVPDFVQALADRNAYNPVADWIRSEPWDGLDRLDKLYRTVVEQPDYPKHLKHILLRKWLLSATAAAVLLTGYKGRGVLTLQGPQSVGKSSWVKALMPPSKLRDDVVKLDHHLDGNNKDSILGAITNWIVEIGELESSFRKDIDRLKGFLTTDFDRVRRPYGRRESEYARRTVFAATVNGTNFLCDPTGNTRWWTIAVERLDFGHDIDMQQLFAQLATQLEEGEEWWLSKEEESQLEAWNSRHLVVSAIAEKLAIACDMTLINRDNLPKLTATETLVKLGYERPTNAQAKECASALRRILGDSKRINGINRWPVPIAEDRLDKMLSGQMVTEEQY